MSSGIQSPASPQLKQSHLTLTASEIFEVLCSIASVNDEKELYGTHINNLGIFLGLTLDPQEGFILWTNDDQNSTKTVRWSQFRATLSLTT